MSFVNVKDFTHLGNLVEDLQDWRDEIADKVTALETEKEILTAAVDELKAENETLLAQVDELEARNQSLERSLVPVKVVAVPAPHTDPVPSSDVFDPSHIQITQLVEPSSSERTVYVTATVHTFSSGTLHTHGTYWNVCLARLDPTGGAHVLREVRQGSSGPAQTVSTFSQASVVGIIPPSVHGGEPFEVGVAVYRYHGTHNVAFTSDIIFRIEQVSE